MQKRFVVRTHIQQNGQAVLRRDAAQRRVESHLADGDAHAAGALVAQAQNALAVRDHDAAHLVIARVRENLLDAVLVRIAEKEAARPAPDLAEALAALAHVGGIHNGQHLLCVVRNQRVEKRFAIVLQVAHVAVLAKGGIAARQHSQAAFPLVFQGSDVRRQQAMQAKGGALLFAEGRALVEPGIMQQLESMKLGANHVRVCFVCIVHLAHCSYLLDSNWMPVLWSRSSAEFNANARRRLNSVTQVP